MSDSFKSISLSAALIGAAIVSLPMASLAQAAPVATSDNLVVVRDAETGQLRAPTAAEVNAMQVKAERRQQSLRAAPQTTLPKVHSSGARGARLTDELMSQSVIVRNADGSLSKQCFESKAAAAAAMTHPDFAARPSFTAKLETE